MFNCFYFIFTILPTRPGCSHSLSLDNCQLLWLVSVIISFNGQLLFWNCYILLIFYCIKKATLYLPDINWCHKEWFYWNRSFSGLSGNYVYNANYTWTLKKGNLKDTIHFFFFFRIQQQKVPLNLLWRLFTGQHSRLKKTPWF